MQYTIIARYVADKFTGGVTIKGKPAVFLTEELAREWANKNLTLSAYIASFEIIPFTKENQKQYFTK